MKKHVILLLLILFSTVINAFSQEGPAFFKEPQEFTVAAPEMASLGKFGMIPVGKYTGTPNVSIPIYAINFDGLSIPIELSYHAGGIRVSEEATWVGLGWNLSANTAITRSINGKNDLDERIGYPYMPVMPEKDDPWSDFQNYYAGNTTDPSGNGERDSEPDLFIANLFGASFKFILEKPTSTPNANSTLDGKPLNNKRMKVQYQGYIGTTQVDGFLVTDDQGFQYLFEAHEETHNFSGLPGQEGYDIFNRAVVTGWQIVKIISPKGREMTFEYSGADSVFIKSQQLFNQYSETNLPYTYCQNEDFPLGNGSTPAISSYSINNVVYLKKIIYEDLEVNFYTSSNRQDLQILENPFIPLNLGSVRESPQRLDQIEVKSNGISVLNAYLTYNSYFNQDDINESDKELYLRLKLDSLQIQDNIYTFDYIQPNNLPAKNSKDTDHWGFYNGKNNTDLIPELLFRLYCAPDNPYSCFSSLSSTYADAFTSDTALSICGDYVRFSRDTSGNPYILFPLSNPCTPNIVLPLESSSYYAPSCIGSWSEYHYVEGADKNADFTYGKIGLLEKITYPTGGYTVFSYEGNEVKMAYEQEYNGIRVSPTSEVNEYSANEGSCYLGGIDSAGTPGVSDTFTISQPLVSSGNGDGGGIWVRNTCLYYDPVTDSVATGFTCGDEQLLCNNAYDNISWEIIDASNGTVVESGDFDYSPYSYRKIQLSSSLPAGSYYLAAYTNYESYKTEIIARIPKYIDSNDPQNGWTHYNVEVGGARVTAITDYNTNGTIAQQRTFSYKEAGLPFSSGVLMNPIRYAHIMSYYNSLVMDTTSFAQRYSIGSNNKMAVQNSAKGNHMGYSRVIETQTGLSSSDEEESNTVTTFQNEPNLYTYLPFPELPPITSEIANGSPTWEGYYTGLANPLLVQEVFYSYNYYVDEYIQAVRKLMGSNTLGTIMTYKLRQEAYLPTETKTRMYGPNGQDYVETIESTSYQTDFYLPEEVSMTNSDGAQKITRTSYTHDFASQLSSYSGSDANTLAIQSLIDKNIYAPLEVRQYEKVGSTERLLSGSHTRFQNIGSLTLPSESWAVETAASSTSFQPISFSTDIQYDTLHQRQAQYDEFDTYGNILQIHQENRQYISVLWGHDAKFLFAKVLNAQSSEIAYTGFESEDKGNWSYTDTSNISAKTGLKGYPLSGGSLSISNLPNGTYTLSCWTSGTVNTPSGTNISATLNSNASETDANGWTFMEWEVVISGSSTLSLGGTGNIDEVRLHPSRAQMSTYCYDEALRLESMTDANNVKITYEYDDLGRLKLTRDHFGNILQRYQYHYANN